MFTRYFVPLLFVVITASCSSTAVNVNVNTSAANSNAATPAAAPADAGAIDQAMVAEKLVSDLYKDHNGKKSPFFQKKDRGLVDKYFTKQLADLIWKDATNTAEGELGALDADPLYSAQDIDIKNFAVGKANVKGDTATVVVTFNNYDQKVAITYSMRQVGGNWKIDDINYGSGNTLVKWLKEAGKPPAEDAHFEGRYQVGDTTCTVKPTHRGFEVRWAKGSGVEVFLYTDGNTYESSPDKGEPNRFVFDDDTYDRGTFYRGDGKNFPVRRAG